MRNFGLHRILDAVKAFGRDRRGAVAPVLAVAAVPLVAAIGLSVDGARGWLLKSRLSQALDAAGLAGGRVILSPTRDDDIRMFFTANLPPQFMHATVTGPNISVDADSTTINLSATASIPTMFMRLVGVDTLTVGASTEVKRTDRGMELVLVMDNTGSMSTNDRIGKMKTAAADLVNILYGTRETMPNFWISLVPYAATVNIGAQNVGWTTVPPSIPRQITLTRQANQSPGTNSGSPPTTSTVCATVAGGGTHGFMDGAIIDIDWVVPANYKGRFMIRTTDATADGCAISAADRTKKFWYVVDNVGSPLAAPPAPGADPASPTGSITANKAGYKTTDPTWSSHEYGPSSWYSSYSYGSGGLPVPGWKGCVEARPSPYEEAEAEAPPSTQLWARQYWPSTRTVRFYNSQKRLLTMSGDYRPGDNNWGLPRPSNDSPSGAAVNENQSAGNDGYGANLGCPPAITPLQPAKSTALAAIGNMAAWSRGGTMANVGLAWGWRVLSPNFRGLWGASTPANMPLDYNTPLIDKVVVLLTDGTNEWYDWNGSGGRAPGCSGFSSPCPLPTDADYTAYGRLGENRLGLTTISNANAQTEINNRMTALCTAMKAKGIIIYTIVVEVPSAATNALYQSCASKPEYYFPTPDVNDLGTVFREIATQLSNLRLSK